MKRLPMSLPFSRKEFFQAGPSYAAGMSISGIQQKLSLGFNKNNTLEIVTRDGEYILKPSPEAFPFAAENEQCAMELSRLAGINTAASGLISFSDVEKAYITKRYDRENGLKLQQEDLCQGFNVPSSEKYEKSYEEALELVHKMSGDKLSVVRDLFNRIVFAYIIGNDDMHLKNISLLKRSENKKLYYDELAPGYDQLFSSSFENSSNIGFLALDLLREENEGCFSEMYKQYGFYTGSDFYTLGNRVYLPDAAIYSVFKSYFKKEKEMLNMIQQSFMPEKMKAKAADILTDRIKALRII